MNIIRRTKIKKGKKDNVTYVYTEEETLWQYLIKRIKRDWKIVALTILVLIIIGILGGY